MTRRCRCAPTSRRACRRCRRPCRASTSSAIFRARLSGLTWYGSSVMTRHGATAGVLLDLDDRAHGDRAAAGAVRVLDAVAADDQAPVGKSGPLIALEQRLEQLLVRRLRVLQATTARRTATSRRLCGGMLVAMPTAMPAEPLTSRFGNRPGRTVRLLRAAVVVGREVDGLLVDVAHHLHRERRQPALGVAHGGRAVVARRAEVALAVDQRVAQRPRLGEPHQRVVDRGVAVRVVLAHHVTDDAGALREAAVGPVAAVVHRVEHAAVHRLEAVAHVGQRAAAR